VVWELFGLPETAGRIYQILLQGDQRVTELIRELGDDTAVLDALGFMLRLSLVQFSGGDPMVVQAVNPAFGLGELLAQQEARIRTGEQELTTMRKSLDRLVSEYHSRQRTAAAFEEVHGGNALAHRLRELCGSTTGALRSLGFEPTVDSPAMRPSVNAFSHDAARLVERKVQVLSIGHDSSRRKPESLLFLQALQATGAHVRTVPAITTWMVIFDNAAALVPHEPERPDDGAVVIHGAGVLGLLRVLFDQLWWSGVDLTEEPPSRPGGLRPAESELLKLLAEGLTDQAAARRLGVSLRTVRRWASELSARLGASSRFQAGLLAKAKGWV
jgi:DNA-binding CsgD family transcriptional regulator